MAKLGLSLEGVKINTGSDFSIVPSGRYTVVVGSAEVGSTKSGSSLILGYKIIEGEEEGKLIKDFLNIENPSVETVRIAKERVHTVAWATNAPMVKKVLQDTNDLLEKTPFDIIVEQVDDGEYKNMKIKAVLCTREVKEEKTEEPKKADKWRK